MNTIDTVKKVWQDKCSGVPEFNLNGCCGNHDNDYKVMGKFKADWKFLKCGWKKGWRYGWKQPHKVVATTVLSTGYYIGVSVLGWIPYFNAQKENNNA